MMSSQKNFKIVQDDKKFRVYRFQYDKFRNCMLTGFPSKIINDIRKFSYTLWYHENTFERDIIIFKYETIKECHKAIKTYNKRLKEGGLRNWWLRLTRGGH